MIISTTRADHGLARNMQRTWS